jgi:hypothetical protein
MNMEQTQCSETSAYKIQTPGNYPEESIRHSEHVESLKSRRVYPLRLVTVILICYSMVSSICYFFILRAKQFLISCIGVLPYISAMLYCILHSQLFLHPHCVPHREHPVTVAIRVQQTCCHK